MKRGKFLPLFKGKFEIEHQKDCGIYSIYFKGSDKFYIGSTNAKNGFYGRWRQHILELRNNLHHNSMIQSMYNEYGESSIKFQIIEICSGTTELILEREQYYIDFFKPELNVNQVARSCVFPEGWISPSAKPVLQYDLDGNFIREFQSISEAKKCVGNCFITLSIYNIDKYTTQSGGFQWRYKTSDDFERKIPKYKYKQETEVICYDSNGDFYKEYQSISKASEDLNIPIGNISRAITGNRNTHSAYGYFFREKVSDNYPMHIDALLRIHKEQFCIDIEDLETGEKYHFDSMRQIPKELFSRSSLNPYMKKGVKEFDFRRNVTKKTFHIKITKL